MKNNILFIASVILLCYMLHETNISKYNKILIIIGIILFAIICSENYNENFTYQEIENINTTITPLLQTAITAQQNITTALNGILPNLKTPAYISSLQDVETIITYLQTINTAFQTANTQYGTYTNAVKQITSAWNVDLNSELTNQDSTFATLTQLYNTNVSNIQTLQAYNSSENKVSSEYSSIDFSQPDKISSSEQSQIIQNQKQLLTLIPTAKAIVLEAILQTSALNTVTSILQASQNNISILNQYIPDLNNLLVIAEQQMLIEAEEIISTGVITEVNIFIQQIAKLSTIFALYNNLFNYANNASQPNLNNIFTQQQITVIQNGAMTFSQSNPQLAPLLQQLINGPGTILFMCSNINTSITNINAYSQTYTQQLISSISQVGSTLINTLQNKKLQIPGALQQFNNQMQQISQQFSTLSQSISQLQQLSNQFNSAYPNFNQTFYNNINQTTWLTSLLQSTFTQQAYTTQLLNLAIPISNQLQPINMMVTRALPQLQQQFQQLQQQIQQEEQQSQH